MKYFLFSIKDVLSGNFSDILIFYNVEMAKRYFENLCKESKISKDLQLFCLGEFDIRTGEIQKAVEFICGGVDNGK